MKARKEQIKAVVASALVATLMLLTYFLPLGAKAVQPFVAQFVNGSGLIIVTNTTTQYGYTNVQYYGPRFFGGNWAGWPNALYWSLVTSNTQPTTGTGGTNYIPYIEYFTNTGAFSTTNPVAGGVITNTPVNGTAWVDVSGFADANGDAAQGMISMGGLIDGPTSTNVFTFTFLRSAGGLNPAGAGMPYDPGLFDQNSSGNEFVFQVFVYGTTNPFAFSTNIPTSFMQGAQKIRLQKIVAGGGSLLTTNCVFTNITLSGYSY